ncbi:MFS transporter superfamily protein [Abortiporus biennis]
MHTTASSIVSFARFTTLSVAVLVALGSGTNYVFSAYGPQLASRLHLTHTQLSIVGLSGTVGVYGSAPLLGKLVDTKGPRLLLCFSFLCVFLGYLGLRQLYVSVPPDDTGKEISTFKMGLLIICGLLTGAGGSGGISSAINAVAKSFPESARATTTSLVLSGFGLSAFFFSTIAHVFFPGNTSSFLLVLAIGTSLPMILGVFFVKPVVMSGATLDRDSSVHSLEDGIERHGEAADNREDEPLLQDDEVEVVQRDEVDDESLPSQIHHHPHPNLHPSEYVIPASPTITTRRQSATKGKGREHDVDHGITGLGLLKSLDFMLLFSIMTLLTGTGLMYINNVGSVSQSLYAHDTSTGPYDPIKAAQWQASQVSTISISNCLGRIVIGLSADGLKSIFRLPRSVLVPVVAFLFIISQTIPLFFTGKVENLWIVSILLGGAYGSFFGLTPSLVIEWFGVAHLSENWGFLSLAPVFGSNFFSIAFGRILDAHSAPPSTHPSPAISPSEGDAMCVEGRACYADAFKLTLTGCWIAFGLGCWLAWRDLKRRRD